MCGISPLFDELRIVKGCLVDDFPFRTDYDLEDLLSQYMCEPADDPENSCKQLVDSFIKPGSFTVEAKKGVAAFRGLPQTVYTNRQLPDNIIYDKAGNILLIIEVHSCFKDKSFHNSVKKTILGTIDLIRYYKGIDPNINKATGYTFPKFTSKYCVVQVVVDFKDFHFRYNLTCTPLADVKTKLLSALNANKQRFRPCFGKPVPKHVHFVKLSPKELYTFKHFCESTHLDPSDHIADIQQHRSQEALLLSCKGRMWKYPCKLVDALRLGNAPKCECVIDVVRWNSSRQEESYFTGAGWFHYPKVKHSPMVPDEAKDCIGDFVSKLCAALTTLHDTGYLHIDVRLENICFDENCTPVLVDLDRCTHKDEKIITSGMKPSIMYSDLEGVCNIDWKQVACILLWICGWKAQLKHNHDYHTQDQALVSHPIVKEHFFILLMEGMYCLYVRKVRNVYRYIRVIL